MWIKYKFEALGSLFLSAFYHDYANFQKWIMEGWDKYIRKKVMKSQWSLLNIAKRLKERKCIEHHYWNVLRMINDCPQDQL